MNSRNHFFSHGSNSLIIIELHSRFFEVYDLQTSRSDEDILLKETNKEIKRKGIVTFITQFTGVHKRWRLITLSSHANLSLQLDPLIYRTRAQQVQGCNRGKTLLDRSDHRGLNKHTIVSLESLLHRLCLPSVRGFSRVSDSSLDRSPFSLFSHENVLR